MVTQPGLGLALKLGNTGPEGAGTLIPDDQYLEGRADSKLLPDAKADQNIKKLISWQF